MKNSLHAITLAKGKYITFIGGDDDELIDHHYFKDAISVLEEQNADMVFAKLIQTSQYGQHRNVFPPFEKIYTPESFISMMEEMRFNYHDFFGFGTCIFRRDKFLESQPFESIFDNTATTDITNIFKYIISSNKIVCLDRYVYSWKKPDSDSLSGSNKINIPLQIIHNLAFPIDIYTFTQNNKSKYSKVLQDFLNKRAEYSFYAILADKEAVDNTSRFDNIFNNLSGDDLYIYGKGWVGLELHNYLLTKKIYIKKFIDDFKTDNDIISFNSFTQLDKPCQVIIATYKYKDLYNIHKRFRNLINVRLLDLYEAGD